MASLSPNTSYNNPISSGSTGVPPVALRAGRPYHNRIGVFVVQASRVHWFGDGRTVVGGSFRARDRGIEWSGRAP